MTSFDYILISMVLMFAMSVMNARLARVNFASGQSGWGWISLAVSALMASAALFNLTQLAGA